MSASTRITTNAELQQWLDANTWFEDCAAVSLTHDPRKVRIVLAELVRGNHVAGTEQTRRVYSLTASGVRRSTAGPDLVFVADNCCEGVELLDAKAGVAFRIDLPGRLDIFCDELNIEDKGTRTSVVKAWLSDHEFGATISSPISPP
jgi:cobalamin biosynthesis protein CbiG